jgi:hypothetical protein
MSVSYPSSTCLLLCIHSMSSRSPECFHFHPWNSSPAEWRCTPDRRCLYRMLWGKPPAEWYSSAKFGSHVNLFLVPIFGVNICPFNYGIKGDFIPELTIDTQRLQAKSVQHPFFPPLNRWSLRLDPNPSSSIFKLQSSNGEPRPSSPGKSYSPQAHSVLPFSNPISNFSFRPLLFLIGSSRRNLDSRRGSISILFPRAGKSFRSLW